MSSRGIQRERQVRDALASQDWTVFRVAGSRVCDLVAIRDGRVLLVEVKSSPNPWAHFRPAARADLAAIAARAGVTATLAWWPVRGQLRLIGADEWPPAR